MSKIKAQISFAATADLEVVKRQLEKIKTEDQYEFYCGFLPRHIVEDKGFDTSIIDVLEGELGTDLVWVLKDCKTFEEAMTILPGKRREISETVEKIFVLDSKIASGVAEEVKEFTKGKVILL